MSKAIYRMESDCGRSGCLHGIFSASKERVEKLLSSGKEIYFGEVLGKHSEVIADFGKANSGDTIDLITDDPAAVEIFDKYDLATGYNPFDYLEEEEEDDEENES